MDLVSLTFLGCFTLPLRRGRLTLERTSREARVPAEPPFWISSSLSRKTRVLAYSNSEAEVEKLRADRKLSCSGVEGVVGVESIENRKRLGYKTHV